MALFFWRVLPSFWRLPCYLNESNSTDELDIFHSGSNFASKFGLYMIVLISFVYLDVKDWRFSWLIANRFLIHLKMLYYLTASCNNQTAKILWIIGRLLAQPPAKKASNWKYLFAFREHGSVFTTLVYYYCHAAHRALLFTYGHASCVLALQFNFSLEHSWAFEIVVLFLILWS